MKKLTFILALALVLVPCAIRAGEDVDADPGREVLLAKMKEYLAAMDSLSVPEAEAEVDFMISSVGDSLFRNRAAVEAYRHFRESRIMGSENVAVHIYDKWFATYRTVFDDIDELDEAQLYAFINRRSLLGCKAPRLGFVDDRGDSLTIPFNDGRKSIIYFYSVGCPKCLYVSMTMSRYLNGHNPSVDLFTIYTGDEEAAWHMYVEKELDIKAPQVSVHNLCGGQTEFALAYGVVQTPRLFLVDEDGVIIGRNLDTDALSRLLE
mgnify:CR=1 FL=1